MSEFYYCGECGDLKHFQEGELHWDLSKDGEGHNHLRTIGFLCFTCMFRGLQSSLRRFCGILAG